MHDAYYKNGNQVFIVVCDLINIKKNGNKGK